MEKKYTWALNPQKLARAIGVAGSEDEGAVKAEYVKIGGLLSAEEQANQTPVHSPVDESTIDSTVSAEEKEEKPKKKTTKKNAK